MKAIASSRYNWKPVVASFLLHMQERGFNAVYVDNGDGKRKVTSNMDATNEASACDEATVYFRSIQHPEEKILPAYLVLGNSPHELVSDCADRPTAQGRVFVAAKAFQKGLEQAFIYAGALA